MYTDDEIESYILNFELDYEKRLLEDKDFPPAFDQKIQPDILEIVATCILNYTQENAVFTAKEIWENPYTIDLCKKVFKKGSPLDPQKKSEWDKVFLQPLNMLSFFGVLFRDKPKKNSKVKSRFIFTILNQKLLEYISRNSRNSQIFISICARCFCRANALEAAFKNFFSNQDTSSFNDLKDDFINRLKYISRNRKKPLDDKKNITRIFTPVLNSQAFEMDMLGTERGRCSKEQIQMSDLLYNRPNFLDSYTNKPKNKSRKEWEREKLLNESEEKDIHGAEAASKAKIRARHLPISEFSHEANATQIHHIFPRHDYKGICYYKENLIALTPTEHLVKAHPNNNTSRIDKHFQIKLLSCKLNSILHSYEENDGFYNIQDFIKVLNIGYDLELPIDCGFPDLIKVLEQKEKNI